MGACPVLGAVGWKEGAAVLGWKEPAAVLKPVLCGADIGTVGTNEGV